MDRGIIIIVFLFLALFSFLGHSVSGTEEETWAVELGPSARAHEIAERHGFEVIRPLEKFEGFWLLAKKKYIERSENYAPLNESKEVLWAELQVPRKHQKRAISDPLYSSQWHLHGETGSVICEEVWNQGITGEGVVVAVVDDGLEYTHPDIADNYRADLSWDFNDKDPNPFPDSNEDNHGTPAAGIAAARDNSACGVGMAYRAGLSGIRVLGVGPSLTDAQEGEALTYKYEGNHIYTNSWGPTAYSMEGPGRVAALGLKEGATNGRGGKGSIYVWAAGNDRPAGDNCNFDGYVNSRFTIAVAAADYRGIVTYYSEPCAVLMITSPSSGSGRGITTTDLLGYRGLAGSDCTSSFGGTSAASPLVAGVIALVLQANPNLGWRDVQGVIIESAIQTDPGNSDWTVNGAGYHVNHNYGFGLINAKGAVEKAKTWKNYPPQISVSTAFRTQKQKNQAIPQGSALENEVWIASQLTVEQVEVVIDATIARRGELSIKLISPFGTVSILAEGKGYNPSGSDIRWTFGSVRHWGESSKGVWKLLVKDEVSNVNVGTLVNWDLILYGH